MEYPLLVSVMFNCLQTCFCVTFRRSTTESVPRTPNMDTTLDAELDELLGDTSTGPDDLDIELGHDDLLLEMEELLS